MKVYKSGEVISILQLVKFFGSRFRLETKCELLAALD
jgi:hypothetical protein